MRSRLLAFTTLILLASIAFAQAPEKKPLLSPRRWVQFAFEDGKKITIDYGAPSTRGRKIMGELVPYGKVWRTGANEATSFVTEASLEVGGVNVPAGKYTLYTLPDQNKWKLIINKQTGQWGTVYDQSQDLARIDLKKEPLAKPVEQLAFSFDKRGSDSATLHIDWENTRLSVDLKEIKEKK